MTREIYDAAVKFLNGNPDHPDRQFAERVRDEARSRVFAGTETLSALMWALDIYAQREAAIEEAIKLYREGDRNAETLTHMWQVLWEQWGKRIGIEVTVPPFSHDTKALAHFEKLGRTLIYIPPEAATVDICPKLTMLLNKPRAARLRQLTHVHDDQFGWLLAETAYERPIRFPDISPSLQHEGVINAIEAGRVQGMTTNTFLVTEAFVKRTTGEFIGSSLLAGSRVATNLIDDTPTYPLGQYADIEPFVSRSRWRNSLYDHPLRTVSMRYAQK